MPDEKNLRIVIVDQNPLRTAILRDGLREAGHEQVMIVDAFLDLERRLRDINPDIVLIDLENPNRDVLEQMIRVSGVHARAVAMFADSSDAAMINAAIDAGVSAYVVDGLKKERVKAIVDLSISRFNAFARLREELAAGHGVLAEIHAQIGRDRLLAKPLPATMAESGTPSLTTTLSLMSAFSSAVEIRFNDIEERIADVAQNYQSDDGRDAGDELATRLLEAASEMRREVDQFLAVGAALSGEIEAAAKDRKIQSRNAHEPRSAMRLS